MKWLLWVLGGLVGLVAIAALVLLAMGQRSGAGQTRSVIEIARPPEVVWTWITEPEKLKQWVGWLVEVRNDTPGVEGVGARETWFMHDPNAKERLAIPSVVTAIDKPRSVTVHIDVPKLFVGDATYTLTPTAGGTRLEQTGTWRYADAIARFIEPLITPEADKKGNKDFEKLKALAEAK